MIQIATKWVWIAAGFLASMLLIIWGLTMYIWGARQQVEGYALGCAAERARNPAGEYIASGITFCYESGTFYHANRVAKSLYRVKK